MSDVDDFEWLRRSAYFRDKSRVRSAVEKQDEIRGESGEGDLSSEVRKWRDKRR
jgi:hypothetical protein